MVLRDGQTPQRCLKKSPDARRLRGLGPRKRTHRTVPERARCARTARASPLTMAGATWWVIKQLSRAATHPVINVSFSSPSSPGGFGGTPVRAGSGRAERARMAAAAGSFHGAAVDEVGSLFVWGRDSHGELGTGDTTDRLATTTSSPGCPRPCGRSRLGTSTRAS